MKILKKYSVLLSFITTFLMFVILMLLLNILGNGNDSVLKGDLFEQYLPFIVSFLNSIKNGNSIWYSFANYIGQGNILTNSYYALNPFNFLFLFDSLGYENIAISIIAIKLGLAAASFNYFTKKVFSSDEFISFLASLFYGLSAFSVSNYFNIIWLDAIYILPFIIFLIIRFFETGKNYLLIVTYLYLFITNFYMGYIVGIFSAVVFISYFFCFYYPASEKKVTSTLLCIGKYIFSVLISVLLSACVTLPTLGFLLGHLAIDNNDFANINISIIDIANMFYLGQIQDINNKFPILYCGLPAFILFIFFFISKKIERKEKVFACIITGFLTIGMIYLPVYKFMHAFDNPDYYGHRFAFLFVFVVLSAFVFTMQKFSKEDFAVITKISLFLIAFYAFMQTINSALINNSFGFICNSVFILSWLMLLKLFFNDNLKNKFMKYIPIAIILLSIIEIETNAVVLVTNQSMVIYKDEYFDNWYESHANAIDSIKSKDSSFNRIYFNNEVNINAAKMFDYNSLNTFSSSDDYNLRKTLSNLGVATCNRSIMSHSNIPGFDMLFAVKYNVDVNGKEYEESKNNVLSLGYMVSDKIFEYQFENNSFNNLENLMNVMANTNEDIYEDLGIEQFDIVRENISVNRISNRYVFNPEINTVQGGYYIWESNDNENEDDIYVDFYMLEPGFYSNCAEVATKETGYCNSIPATMGGIYKFTKTGDNKWAIGLKADLNEKASFFIDNINFAKVNKAALDKIYNELSKNQLEIDCFREDYIEGKVEATKEKSILFTTIPFDSQWYVFVDGKQVAKYPALNNRFIAIVLEPGIHSITFEYMEKYSNEGMLLSLLAATVFFCMISFNLLRGLSKKNK